MAKYRLLNSVELEALQDDFIKFLVLNGITAQDWISIKESQPLITNGLIEAFSDVVFEGIIRKTEYLEYADKSGIKVFKCEAEKITLVGLDHLANEEIDYSDFEKLSHAMSNRPDAFTIYKISKPYNPNRSTEIFKMISSGAVATDSKLFELLEKLC